MGLPEQYAAPPGFEKVVCTSTAAAEKWSARMRKWEETKEEIAQMYQRHQEEKQFKAVLSDIDNKIANARDNINRDFMIQARANAVKRYEDRFAMTRESFLHSEAYSADDKSVATPKVRLPTKLAHGGVFNE
jgi:primosomal protein N''